ncbi:hypothetical protein Cylst_6239 [Cylindrospermum stagnale PCC 7417]|uniref:HMA domain-containing protein n=1 Tax=Cylindrospermum stagnale PCC 7417 TaxID=56107 RepID=K9X6T4_9NOST|nr:hypothetical protein [Cylindrospermum stagnale]AFZ28198.1 hypothetical protein Cylst_6239 [Cylindrospermum stagnale PCC 7417]
MSRIVSSRDGLSPQPKISPDLISTQGESDEVIVNDNNSEAVAQLNGLQIIHAIPGRVRIRAIKDSFNSLETLSQYLRQQDGVRAVAINQQTGSLVVTFDEDQLSLPQVLRLLQQFGIHQRQISPHEDAFAEWKSLEFWKEQSISLIPLMTGLAVTGGLGIKGLVAIPVYIIAADATRWVIDYLEPQVTPSAVAATKFPEEQDSEVAAPPAKIAYSVVHAIAGRIRFHVPLIAEDRAYGQRLEKLLKTDAQVVSVRVNYDAASIAISYAAPDAIAYQPSDISISHWVNLMELALQTHPPTDPVETTELQLPTEAMEVSSLWANMQPTSMSYSLAFLANLPL